MELLYMLIAALLPVVLLLWYVLRKDKDRPEPAGLLLGGFAVGIASVFVSFAISLPMEKFLGLSSDSFGSFGEALGTAFLIAAVPEECAKLLMLWLLLRKNRHYDENFDGIVYAVCVGLGFAAFENVMYLVEGLEDGSWVGTGVVRALFTVPGHFFFAVLMGYYYSIFHFGIDRSFGIGAAVILVPVIAHGLFDAVLMSSNINDDIAAMMFPAFLAGFIVLKRFALKRLKALSGW